MFIRPELFNMTKICDTESSRYALGGVMLERDAAGKPHAITTDGRVLVHATWDEPDHNEYPAGVVETTEPVPGFSAIMAKAHMDKLCKEVPKKSPKPIICHGVVNETPLANGMIEMGATDLDTSRTLKCRAVEGRFPRWQDVFTKFRVINGQDVEANGLSDMAVRLRFDAFTLAELLEVVRKSAGLSDEPSQCVTLLVPLDRNQPIIVRCVEGGVNVEGVVMPIATEEWTREDKAAYAAKETACETPPADSVATDDEDEPEGGEEDGSETGDDGEVEEDEPTSPDDECDNDNTDDDSEYDDVEEPYENAFDDGVERGDVLSKDAFYVERSILSAGAGRIDPVSGGRCRICGASANREVHDGKWLVAFSTAYCPKCAEAATVELGISTACKG